MHEDNCLKRKVHVWRSVWTLSRFVAVTNQRYISSSQMTLWCHPFFFFGNSKQQNEILKTTPHIYYQCFLSAFHLLCRYLSSITGRTWETGAWSQVWLLFSFHQQTRVVKGTISPSSCSFSSFHLEYKIYISVGFTAVNQRRDPFVYLMLLYACAKHEWVSDLSSLRADLLWICLPANQAFVNAPVHCVFMHVCLPLRFHY